MTLSPSAPAVSAITARGPLSAELLEVLLERAPARAEELPQLARDAVLTEDPITDDDVQLSLFLLYAVAYGSLPQFGAHWEWDVSLLTTRAVLERAFEDAVRATVPLPERPEPTREAVAATLFALTAPQPGPSLSHFVARKADVGQARELLIQRSIYTLREADAHSWAIPRLTGRAKAALIEIQADEYGGGRVERMHQVMYADAMRGAGLDDSYAAYADRVPAITFASFNLMTMFGMNRRLRGAAVGHLAAFEMTSSLPCRAVAEGLRRVGFGDDVAAYYDEHVEADAVHEQIAGRDLAGSLAEDEPDLLDDILFGAAACLTIDGWASEHILHAWEAGRSSLCEERQSD
ncbi:iron-containing redox enzyme family protein [Microbacterium sp. NPDC089318]